MLWGKLKCWSGFPVLKEEMSIDNQPRSGRPSTARTNENDEKIWEVILEDRRRTIEEVVELSGVTSEDLGMRREAAKFVPKLLAHSAFRASIFDQKWYDYCASSSLFTRPSPLWLFLFPRMKMDMKGKRFADVTEVKTKTTEALAGITKEELKKCFEQ